jgi:hypothetical protein
MPPCERKDEKLGTRLSNTWRQGERSLTSGWRSPASLPRGLGGHCGCGRRGHRRTPSHLRGARRRLRGARHLSRRLPGGGCSRASPRRCLLCRSAALGEGVKAPTSRGESVPHRSPPPLPTTNLPMSLGERVPAAHAAGTPRLAAPGAPAVGSSSLSCAPPSPAPAASPRVHAPELGAWAGQTARRPRPSPAKGE